MTLRRFARSALLLAAALSSVSVSAQVTSNFGVRSDPFHRGARMHAGIDIAAPMGAPVVATGDGWVTFAGWKGGYGYMIEIQHPSGHTTRFAHLSRILVAPSQAIRRGTVIGLIGSTGRSTGPHLHYEVRFNGKPLDPRAFM